MDQKETIKLAIKSLLEVVQTGAKNIEIAIMTSDSVVKVSLLHWYHLGSSVIYCYSFLYHKKRLEQEEIESAVAEIEKEKEEEAEKKKKPSAASGSR